MVQLWHMGLLSSKTILNTSEYDVAPKIVLFERIVRYTATVLRFQITDSHPEG